MVGRRNFLDRNFRMDIPFVRVHLGYVEVYCILRAMMDTGKADLAVPSGTDCMTVFDLNAASRAYLYTKAAAVAFFCGAKLYLLPALIRMLCCKGKIVLIDCHILRLNFL